MTNNDTENKNEQRWKYINSINLGESMEVVNNLQDQADELDRKRRDIEYQISKINREIERGVHLWWCGICKVFMDSFDDSFTKNGSIGSFDGINYRHSLSDMFHKDQTLIDGQRDHPIVRVTRSYEVNKIIGDNFKQEVE